MGLHILNKISEIVHINNHSLYRDGGLMIAPDNRSINDKISKLFLNSLKVSILKLRSI